MSKIRKRTIEGLRVGDSFTVSRTFTEEDVLKFSEITRDYNPVHFEDRFSAVKKFNGRICHGLLIASILTEIGGQIGWLASVMNFRFKRPVYLEDTITCNLTITELMNATGKSDRLSTKIRMTLSCWKPSLEGIVAGSSGTKVLS